MTRLLKDGKPADRDNDDFIAAVPIAPDGDCRFDAMHALFRRDGVFYVLDVRPHPTTDPDGTVEPAERVVAEWSNAADAARWLDERVAHMKKAVLGVGR